VHPSAADPEPAGEPAGPPSADPQADRGRAENSRPGYPQPEYLQPGYLQPEYQQPGYPQPESVRPEHPQPGSAKPDYAQPQYGQPELRPPTADQQYTAQLPRRPDTGRFPYPAPPTPGPDQRTGQYRAPTPMAPPASDWAPAQPGQPSPDRNDPRSSGSPPPYRNAPYQQPIADEPYAGPYQGQSADAITDVNLPRRPVGRPEPSPRGSHLPPYSEPFGSRGAPADAPEQGSAGIGPAGAATAGSAGVPRTGPRKLTVTRVAAFRSRELTTRGVRIFQRAATADGADRSGLTALTYAVMGNYAVDAALAVALANTLFFAAATAESTSKVLLYLLITVAPFAVIAPLIGPALDKLQHGRRIALGASSFARALLAVVMALNFDSWILYPCALGMLVLSKSFSVLKAAITPRVLPPDMTLVKTNSRMTVFGLLAGGVAGALAAALSWAFGSTGALVFTALLSIAGGWLCLRIPAWVESTAGEVPVDGVGPKAKRAFPLSVTTTMWANGTIRVETGFLALFIAFVIKSEYTESSGFTQLLLLGVVGLAAGLGGFLGNGLGSQLPLSKPETVSILSLAATALATLVAVLVPGLATAAVVGLVGSTASSLAKVCLDSVIQHELPEESRASAFGLSETVLQLSWVFGGVVGLLIGGVWSFGHDSVYTIGFAVITVVLVVGLIQSWLVRSGRSLFPWLDYSKLTKHFRRSTGRVQTDRPAKTSRFRKAGADAAQPRDAGAPPTADWQPPNATAGGGPAGPGPAYPSQQYPAAGRSPGQPYQPQPAWRPPASGQPSQSAGQPGSAYPPNPSYPPAPSYQPTPRTPYPPTQSPPPAQSPPAQSPPTQSLPPTPRDAGSPRARDAARPRKGFKRP
jgi:MFS family permease